MEEIIKRYTEPHRKYHTLHHLAQMLHLASDRGIKLSDEQQLAIWFHDVIYDVPAPKDISNEKLSSEFARDFLERDRNASYFNWPRVDLICAIIEDTEYPHMPTIPESAVVIDLDLSGLGLNYWRNKELIRDEFSCYSDEEFNKGRLGWLKSMQKREKVFVSGLFDDLEDGARSNIEAEIKILENL